MPPLSRRERFTQSKCDRCGKATPAEQNGIGDLYVLPDDFEELRDAGDFCQRCIGCYDLANWRTWFAEHRTGDTNG